MVIGKGVGAVRTAKALIGIDPEMKRLAIWSTVALVVAATSMIESSEYRRDRVEIAKAGVLDFTGSDDEWRRYIKCFRHDVEIDCGTFIVRGKGLVLEGYDR